MRISERIATRLVAPLAAVGAVDCFFVVDFAAAPATSSTRWRAAFDGFPVLGLRQSSDNLAKKRELAFTLLEGVEAAARRRYAYVLTTRPDLDHLAVVDAAALATLSERTNLFDIIGRSEVT